MDDQVSLFRQMSRSPFPLPAAEVAAHDGRTGPAATQLDVEIFVAAWTEPAFGFVLPGIASASSVTAESADPNVDIWPVASRGCLEYPVGMLYYVGDGKPGIGAVSDKARVEVQHAGAGDNNEPAAVCADSVPAGSGSNLEAPVADVGSSEAFVRAGPVAVDTQAGLDIHLHCEMVLSGAASDSDP